MRLVDNRALLGALALNITGVILAFMLYQYLGAVEGSRTLTRSRLVWEVVLNLQILSAALIWFCYSDRIDGSVGAMKLLQRLRLWFALVTVLLPSILGLLGIQQNWFEEQPTAAEVRLFAYIVLAYWLLGVWLNARVRIKRSSMVRTVGWQYRLLFLSPAILLAIVFAVDILRGGQIWLLAIPVLTYLQGSMPFITKAFGLR